MHGENGVTRSIIDEFHYWDIQGDQMEDKNGLTRNFIDELYSSDIQRDQIEGEKLCYSKYHC